MLSILIWLITVELLGLAALPLAMATLPRLADRGYGLSKILGVLLLTFLNYLFGTNLGLGNSVPLLVIGIMVIFIVGLAALWPRRYAALGWLRGQRDMVLVEEAVFIVLMVAWAAFRAAHPAIFSTEKPMDLALMTASHKATSFPPYDPWLAGATINYYYGGYLAIGTLVTLTGVAPAVGYNLGLALLAGLVGSAAFSVAYGLTRNLRWAILGPIFVLLVGNLDGLGQFLSHGGAGFNFFNSSRVVEPTACGGGYCTITEFPAFSFLLGDLHPHVIALPFTILAIGYALNLALAPAGGWAALASDNLGRALTIALTAIAAGALYFMNSWDWPTYLLLIGAALLLPGVASSERRPLGEGAALAIGVLALSYLFYYSFHHDFNPQYSSFGVKAHSSPTGQVLTMFGLFLLPAAAFIGAWLSGSRAVGATATPTEPRRATVAASTTRSTATPPAASGRRAGAAVMEREPADDEDDDLPRLPMPSLALPRLNSAGGAALALIAAAVVLWLIAGLSGLLLPFLTAALYLAWREARAARRETAFGFLLCAGGIGLIVLCEIMYLKDNFCGPDASGNCTGALYRMNTVFKFYYQAWTVLALGAAYALYALATRLRAGGSRFLIPSAAVALAAAGGVYLLIGVVTPTTDSLDAPVANAAPTLDGSAYLASFSGAPITGTATLAGDAAAIRWLNATVSGHPTILEAQQVTNNGSAGPQDYWVNGALLMARVSTFTGLPAVLGLGYSHEGLWHGDSAVATRFTDVQTMYTSADTNAVGTLLRQYHVAYIYVGPIEAYTYYGSDPARLAAALARFQRFGRVVYTREGVTIIKTPYGA